MAKGQTQQGVHMGIEALHYSYQSGRLGAQAAASKPDFDRGWSVARQSLVRNEAASAAKRGLMETSRRWQIWSEVVQAMEQADLRERREPGCCTKMLFWFQNFFSLFEFFFRVSWHIFFAGFWAMFYLCMKENPTVLANMGYHGMAIGAYCASLGVIWYNVTNPGKPAYKFGGFSKFDKPVPPLASGDNLGNKPEMEQEEDRIRPRGLVQNMCFVCRAKHPLQHMERFWKSLFCCLSCHRSLHPSTTCGPCCMCCRGCYNTLPQRVTTWNTKIQHKRDPHLRDFYRSTFNCNTYEEYVQRRLSELASAPPVPETAMQRGADVTDLEEGLALGVLEAFVGRGQPRAGQASEPAYAALGVIKGMVGVRSVSEHDAEYQGAVRGQQMSVPLQQALGLVKALVGELAQEAKTYKAETQEAVQHLQQAPSNTIPNRAQSGDSSSAIKPGNDMV